jgi:hypothetical protein
LADPIPGLKAISSNIALASLIGQPALAAAAKAIIAINNISLPSQTGQINLGSMTCLASNSRTGDILLILSSQLADFSSQITSAFAGFER